MDKVEVITGSTSVITVAPCNAPSVTVIERGKTKVSISERGSQGPRGLKGDPGDDAIGSESSIINLIHANIHGNAGDDGIDVDGQGNIRLSIGTLQTIP